jgi:hypothetical protein
MVRLKVKEPKHQFSVMLKPSVVAQIDAFAEKYDMTRSQLMANLMEAGMEELRTLDEMGIVPLFYHGGNIMRKFKEAFFSGKVSVDEKGDIKIIK